MVNARRDEVTTEYRLMSVAGPSEVAPRAVVAKLRSVTALGVWV